MLRLVCVKTGHMIAKPCLQMIMKVEQDHYIESPYELKLDDPNTGDIHN